MKGLKITVSGSQSKQRHTWAINPVTRVHENNPKRNKKRERQKSKLLLKKAHDDAPFAFAIAKNFHAKVLYNSTY